VLITSHNMGDVVALCSRVLIIDRGHLIFDGDLKQVVKRFAPKKVIRVDFSRPVPHQELTSFSSLQTREELKAVFEVPRSEVSKSAAQILTRLPVADLTIEETPIDEIVREIFRRGMPPGTAA